MFCRGKQRIIQCLLYFYYYYYHFQILKNPMLEGSLTYCITVLKLNCPLLLLLNELSCDKKEGASKFNSKWGALLK